jgi:predicted transcriptional regulator
MAKDVTTIRVSTDLRDKLKELGKKGETYDEIIERLLKIAIENMGGKN